MSKSNTRPSETNDNTTNKGQILTYVQPKLHNLTQDITSNVSTATFSSMSKQAESLVSGGNNVVFNPYNNNLVFQWVSMNMNDCLSIDIINRTLLNLMSLKFVNNGEIRGISDGFTVDSRGQIVQIYDPTIALSCAFGYKIQTESDETAGRLNIEIERRQLDFETLLNKYKETDANAIHAESMIHYIDFDLINHVAEQNAMRISTSVLNQVINEAIAIVQPPTDKGKRLKIFYGTQASTKPPTFVIFVNSKELFHFSYERYLVNQIRKEFGLEGTPVRIIVREKKEEK